MSARILRLDLAALAFSAVVSAGADSEDKCQERVPPRPDEPDVLTFYVLGDWSTTGRDQKEIAALLENDLKDLISNGAERDITPFVLGLGDDVYSRSPARRLGAKFFSAIFSVTPLAVGAAPWFFGLGGTAIKSGLSLLGVHLSRVAIPSVRNVAGSNLFAEKTAADESPGGETRALEKLEAHFGAIYRDVSYGDERVAFHTIHGSHDYEGDIYYWESLAEGLYDGADGGPVFRSYSLYHDKTDGTDDGREYDGLRYSREIEKKGISLPEKIPVESDLVNIIALDTEVMMGLYEKAVQADSAASRKLQRHWDEVERLMDEDRDAPWTILVGHHPVLPCHYEGWNWWNLLRPGNSAGLGLELADLGLESIGQGLESAGLESAGLELESAGLGLEKVNRELKCSFHIKRSNERPEEDADEGSCNRVVAFVRGFVRGVTGLLEVEPDPQDLNHPANRAFQKEFTDIACTSPSKIVYIAKHHHWHRQTVGCEKTCRNMNMHPFVLGDAEETIRRPGCDSAFYASFVRFDMTSEAIWIEFRNAEDGSRLLAHMPYDRALDKAFREAGMTR